MAADKDFYLDCAFGAIAPTRTYLGKITGYSLPTADGGHAGGTLSVLAFADQQGFNGFVSDLIDNGDGTETIIALDVTGKRGELRLSMDGKTMNFKVFAATAANVAHLAVAESEISGEITWGYCYP